MACDRVVYRIVRDRSQRRAADATPAPTQPANFLDDCSRTVAVAVAVALQLPARGVLGQLIPAGAEVRPFERTCPRLKWQGLMARAYQTCRGVIKLLIIRITTGIKIGESTSLGSGHGSRVPFYHARSLFLFPQVIFKYPIIYVLPLA